MLGQMCDDIAKAVRIADYAGNRVFNGDRLPSAEKIPSFSDESAVYIQ